MQKETNYITKEDVFDVLRRIEIFLSRTNGKNFLTQFLRRQIVEQIKKLPAADVRPVVRGKWERPKGSTSRSWIFRCSVCGERAYFPVPKYFPKGCGYNFCPNCGAEMRNTAALEDAAQDADAGAMAPAT